MIFVTLGSQKFQFDRLLKAVDRLAENGEKDEIFAQTGHSTYQPKHYRYKAFLDRNEFADMMDKADIVITHGGTGAIIGAIKKGKKVIAVPRLSQYGEHVDDHQLQIIGQFYELNLIGACEDCADLEEKLEYVRNTDFSPYQSNTQRIIDDLEDYIDNL